MRSNVNRRSQAVEAMPKVDQSSLDYDDGEVVVIALFEEYDEDTEEFIENELGLEVISGPKWVGVGVEVVLG